MHRCGIAAFTLVELLVVVAIIALLLSILMPATRRARFAAEVTACAAHQADLGRYMIQSAMDDRGKLGGGYVEQVTGRNTWDVGAQWADGLLERGMPLRSFVCPQLLARFDGIEDFRSRWYVRYADFRRVGYAIWVSRLFKNGWSPPDPGDTSHTIYDDGVVPGPKSLTDVDPQRRANPITSCIVDTGYSSNPYPIGVDLSQPGAPVSISTLSSHLYEGTLAAMNQTFADGSTRVTHGRDLKPRYRSNNGQPIMWR